MQHSSEIYRNYLKILNEELIPAMGCTEPIAIAYAGAAARQLLGKLPDRVVIEASGNIIKNVKSVIVPNTGSMHGIPAAAGAGIIFGRAERVLEVISEATEEQQKELEEFLRDVPCEVKLTEDGPVFDIIVSVYAGDESARVRIAEAHTNIVLLEKNGEIIKEVPVSNDSETWSEDRSCLSVEGIYDFAESVDIADVKELLDRQIGYNYAISEEGIRGDYGANIGRTIMRREHVSLREKCIAMAAAGSDARMNGCELPVIINSGSGNQGITVSVPVIVYAREAGCPDEQLYRALVLSNLISIYQKTEIGRLSAFCGAVNAGASAGCGIAYLKHHSLTHIKHTLVNALAVSSGIICDGAKASCAGKIAVSVETGLLGLEMYENGQQFFGGDGILKKGADNVVHNVGQLGREGMRETDREILKIMLKI